MKTPNTYRLVAIAAALGATYLPEAIRQSELARESDRVDPPSKLPRNRMPHQGKKEIERRRRQMERDRRKIGDPER